MSSRNGSAYRQQNETRFPPFVEHLSVLLGNERIGMLATTDDGRIAFAYDSSWIATGFSISPLSLPLRNGVFVAEAEPFDGLFGVFNDSLPDGWGALLLDRKLREYGCDPRAIPPLTRLALVGSTGKGALHYEPEVTVVIADSIVDLDDLARDCRALLENEPVSDLDAIYVAGGSSGGARPKAYIEHESSTWLVKFPSHLDPADIGAIEYEYALCAQSCGIETAHARLFPSNVCSGYYGSKRFDRDARGRKIHMVSASGLLEVTHRLPLLDYDHLFKLSQHLTGCMEQTWKLYRLMCFNVFAHNQDDHSNNFSWLCIDGTWQLSPAYDLTYSTSYGNEHATTVNGHGRPGMDDILAVGERFGLPASKARRTAEEIRCACAELLEKLGLSQV